MGSLSLLNPTQVAEITLSSGALNNTDQIVVVFDRLEKGDAFLNMKEFLTELNAAPEASQSAEMCGIDRVDAPEKGVE